MKLPTAISPAPPTATPGGRAVLKAPVAKTVLPTTTWLQTTPLICQVGRTSTETVGGVTGVVTSCGAVSAAADPAGMTVRPTATTAVEAADTTHLVIREMPT